MGVSTVSRSVSTGSSTAPSRAPSRLRCEPVEIAAALQRECDDRAAIVDRGRTWCPTSSPSSSARTTTTACRCTPSRSAPSSPRWCASTPTSRGTSSSAPVEVSLELADDLDTGLFRIRSDVHRRPCRRRHTSRARARRDQHAGLRRRSGYAASSSTADAPASRRPRRRSAAAPTPTSDRRPGHLPRPTREIVLGRPLRCRRPRLHQRHLRRRRSRVQSGELYDGARGAARLD